MAKNRALPVDAYIRDRPELAGPHSNANDLRLWRSLEEAGECTKVRRILQAENSAPANPGSFDRRAMLNFMTASLALGGLAGCAVNRQPFGAPLLSQPFRSPQHTPGVPLFFATSLELDGLGRGVLVKSHDGRPVKIEGNPQHPASLGATDVFSQAEVLSLYDPDRSKHPIAGGERRSWTDARQLIAQLRQQFLAKKGRGLRILLQPCASPTRDRLIRLVRQAFPEARWHAYSPLPDDQGRAATRAVFARPLDQVFALDRADVILTLGGDLLGSGPGHVRYAADYADRRRAADRSPPVLYTVETTPSLTGARADRRLAAAPREIEHFARQAFAYVEMGAPATPDQLSVARRAAEDLARAGPHALVAAGREQPVTVQAIAHALNSRLGAIGTTVRYIEPLFAGSGEMETLTELASAIAAGDVEALLILGGNPVYDAPTDIEFAKMLGSVPLSIHVGTYRDETGLACRWHLPARHPLESWGDLRAFDGTVGLRQPATVPLIEATTPEELLGELAGEAADARELVQATWRAEWGADFDARWITSLEQGLIEGSGEVTVPVQPGDWSPPPATRSPPAAGQTVVFAPDPSVWDGRFANNAWLQELPKPLSKQVWGNAAFMAPADASALGLRGGDIAVFRHNGRSIEAPVWPLPGHAQNAVTVTLGYGRTAAGKIGNSRGFDAYRLRTSQEPWIIENVDVLSTGRRERLVTTQHHHSMEGRDIVRVVAPGAASASSSVSPPPSFYPDFVYDGNAWGMTIDLDVCLGCNACVIACQAENNVPVVGPEEVARGREMHWLRIDRYYSGHPNSPQTYFQPVPCMHCEKAPCELVCPVNATVHSSEGLNEMTYSRCVGTRTCSNNCPYKVRRFNWFDYSRLPFAATDDVFNPEVTVRWRGIMEKCTYCVQRISATRIAARIENRPIRDGELMTACQQACPTRAIVFGDINDPASLVRKQKQDPRNYALLGELNTQPRTTYLARISDGPSAQGAADAHDDAG